MGFLIVITVNKIYAHTPIDYDSLLKRVTTGSLSLLALYIHRCNSIVPCVVIIVAVMAVL